MKKYIFLLVIFSLMAIFTGCTLQKKPNPSPDKAPSSTVEANPNLQQGERVKTLVKDQIKEVGQATAVVLDNNIYVGLKVSGFDRLNLKSIREKTLKQLQRAFPKDTIHVTTDKKVYWRIEQLESAIQKDPALPKKDIESQLKKIEKDMKG